jgi:IMP dehydrogenase/GMP reductase
VDGAERAPVRAKIVVPLQFVPNLIGALRTAMGFCGAATIQEMHKAEMVIAPSIVTEGKSWQIVQSCS